MLFRNLSKKVILVLGILIWASFVFPLYAAQWESVSPLNSARDQFTGGAINGKIFVFGGNRYPDGSNLKSTEMFDPSNNTWSYRSDNEHNSGWGVEELSGAVYNGKLYVFGAWGGGNPYGVFDFVEEYNPITDTWISKAAKPTTVAGAPAALYRGEIFLFGGGFSTESGPQTYYDVVEAYNPLTDTWRYVTKMPSKITGMAIGILGSKAYLIGGVNPNNFAPYLDVIAYDFELDQWTVSGLGALTLPRILPYSTSAPIIDGKIYLIGGITCSSWPEECENSIITSDDVLIYDPSQKSFTSGLSLPEPVGNHTTIMFDNAIYVIGGSTVSGDSSKITNKVWKL
jgi:N-acetylneuraminic acid mutarotase